MKPPINTRQQIFVHNLVMGKTQTQAYKDAYKDVTDETARVNASKLLTNTNIKRSLEEQLKDGAQHAYDVLQSLLNDPMTPANVRKDIAKDMLDRGHGTVTQKTETKTETTFKGISDISKEELKAML